ncbi:MAG: hypothetical protein ACRDQ1_03990, partial [Sciscionella sp.]
MVQVRILAAEQRAQRRQDCTSGVGTGRARPRVSKGITTHSDSVEHKRDDRTTESAAEHALLGKARAY